MPFNSFLESLFMSPSQKKKQDEKYFRKMFPFGDEQRDWENKVIETLYADNAEKISTIKYMCLIRREMFADFVADDSYYENKYRKLISRMSLSENDINFIETFSKLEFEAKSYYDLPTLQEIKEKCNL